MQAFLVVGLGGALGAMGRYGVGLWVGRNWQGGFPMGTFAVNVIGSLFMGLFIGWLVRTTPDWQASARLFMAVGVLGGFTTFSAFSLDVVTLLERGQMITAVLYGVASLALPVLALFAGMMVMRAGGGA